MSTETSAAERVDAATAVARLMDESSGIRACAILGAGGAVLAESSENDWAAAVADLWSAAAEGGPAPTQIHVATEEGEVYAARSGEAAAVAITDRFTLGSLMFCDLRSALRNLPTASR